MIIEIFVWIGCRDRDRNFFFNNTIEFYALTLNLNIEENNYQVFNTKLKTF